MKTDTIIQYIEANPRCTAKEAGTTTAVLNELEAQGLIENVGVRDTGQRGRPSHEWALPGVIAQEDHSNRLSCGIPGAPALPDLTGILPHLRDEDQRIVNYVIGVYERPGGRQKADIALLYNTVQRIVKKVGVTMESVEEAEGDD